MNRQVIVLTVEKKNDRTVVAYNSELGAKVSSTTGVLGLIEQIWPKIPVTSKGVLVVLKFDDPEICPVFICKPV